MTPAEQAQVRAASTPPPHVVVPTREYKLEDPADVELACDGRLRVTDKACLFRLHNGRQVWVPKSVIRSAEDFDDGTWLVTVAGWFADKERLTDK